MTRRILPGLLTAITVACTGCATGLDRLPLPAPGLGGDTYTLTATFTNALNLPAQAKVTLNGAEIGRVESMAARDYTAVVTLRITAAVRLPVGTSAQLRSGTPMGDVFVAMKPPPVIEPGAAVLADGAAIGPESTTAASTIEEMLSRAALLVNGGTVGYLTTVVAALSEYVGGRGDRLAALLDETRALLGTLTQRTDQINGVLGSAAELTGTVAAEQAALADAVAAAGPAVEVLAENTDALVALVDRVHTITTQLARFPSVRGTNETSMAANINTLAAGLNAAATNPQADLNAVNDMIKIVLKMISGPNGHVAVDIAQLAVPDPASPGGAGGRAPDITDWTAFVGSLQHMIARLGGRLVGVPR
ncbi:MlaD family protein [Nocardia sp. GTS18]|uniref:MlaD family protein n=1 Tax=Nocardia sp. GTS18 TaxID=1778064 RepID=UPI0015EF1F63|nr:MlaD family protein [Nocardia sp. GTS18]